LPPPLSHVSLPLTHWLLELHVYGLLQYLPSGQQLAFVGMHPPPHTVWPGHLSTKSPLPPPPPQPVAMIDRAPNIINTNSANPLISFCCFLIVNLLC
jgi:hypothetical protein